MRKTLSHCLRHFRQDQGGTVLVEMALIVPLMVVLSAGIFEFGRFLHDKLLVEAGLSDAARFAARCNSQLYTDNGLTAINCATLAASIAVYGKIGGTTTDTPRVVGWQASDVTINSSTCVNAVDPGTGTVLYLSTTSQVCVVTASTNFHYQDLGMLSLVGVSSITVGGQHQERLIRF
ncbi:TadE/TadG family type IV pilus assembly protein [Mesorhizobium hawassense]|nr:TadE/TadG family type IV pilus assembly protein [Mesorhizobium hawassense]